MEDKLTQFLGRFTPRNLILTGLAVLVAAGVLMSAGGFDFLSRIFGSKAGTAQTLILAGAAKLQNSTNAADWLVTDSAPTLNGSGIFTEFADVPSFLVPDSLEAGFIVPLSTATEVDQDAYWVHQYSSPVINLGQTGMRLNQLKIYAYLPEDAKVGFGYRVSESDIDISAAELHALEVADFMATPENDQVQVAALTPDRALKQYLQLTIDFQEFGLDSRPAVYGWAIDYGEELPPEVAPGSITSADDATGLKLTFSGGRYIPTDAHIQLLTSELALNPIFNQDHLDLTLTNGEYVIPLALGRGAYTVLIESPTTKTKIVPFLVDGADSQIVHLEAFEAGATTTDFANFDLNGDGKINTMDVQMLFERYGETS